MMKSMLLSMVAAVFLIPGAVHAQAAKGLQASASDKGGKVLVVYFSRSGNTQAVANRIQALTGADVFRVETVSPYPEDYRKCTEVAKEELNRQARPAIRGKVDNLDRYDTVFIGFPIWWGSYPMAVATFLDEYDLAGKTVIPFCTHGGSSRGQSFSDLAKSAPGALFLEGLAIRGSQAASAGASIQAWLRKIDIVD